MKPILFHLGPLPVFSFGFLVAAGLMLSLYLMGRRAKRIDFLPGDTAFDLVFVTVLSGFAAARFHYILQNLDWYVRNPLQIFALWEGGLIFYGGMIGALAGLWIFLKIKKISFLRGLDFLVPYVALTHAFGRIGCFLNGCCYGKACDLPWAVKFPELPQPVHPAQLYEAGFDLLLFLFLNALYEKRRFDGQIATLYFMFYAAGRFVIEFFRDNPMGSVLTINQWLSVVAFAAAIGFYARFRLRG